NPEGPIEWINHEAEAFEEILNSRGDICAFSDTNRKSMADQLKTNGRLLPPLRPSGQQHRQFQITQANPQRQSNVELDFLSQMQNLHSSEPPQNFLRPPKLQLYTPLIGSNIIAIELLDQGYTVQMATLNRGVAYPTRATTLDGFLGNLQYLGLNSSLQSRQQNFFDMLYLGNFAHSLNCAHSLKMFFLFCMHNATQYIVTSSEFRHEFTRGWLYGIFIFISLQDPGRKPVAALHYNKGDKDFHY
ncbi:hypothetical protein ACJX0J_009442, partial [Zea mays]